MTAARVPRGQQTLPPPTPADVRPRPLLPAAQWREAIAQERDLTRATKIVAARLTDHAADDARVIPAPQIAAVADAAQMNRVTVTGCITVLQVAGWLAASAGPGPDGRPLLRLCDGRTPQ